MHLHSRAHALIVHTTDAGGGDASCIRVFDLATPQIPRVYVAQNDVIRDVAFTDRSMLAMMSSGAILTQLLSSENFAKCPAAPPSESVGTEDSRARRRAVSLTDCPERTVAWAHAR